MEDIITQPEHLLCLTTYRKTKTDLDDR